ncbi:hypothetical protein K4F52_004833 [Lecanicillium sp. MT-2017a]|nr:hypothetical protein K4F52_004833 [Lecanicillium sp. MT-2017a]
MEKQKIQLTSQAEKQIQKLHLVHDQLSEAEKNSHRVLTVVRDMLHGVVEVKDILLSVSKVIVDSQITSSHGMFMRFLDPTKELPVMLEDALGRSLPIPAQWIHTLEWTDQKGQDMVRRQEYKLEESATGTDLDTDMPLHRCLRRGMKIHMSMLFYDNKVVAGECPRCHTVTDAPEAGSMQWYVAFFLLEDIDAIETTKSPVDASGSNRQPTADNVTLSGLLKGA